MLKNKKIIIGISGGIAAYKSATLIRLCVKAGAEVKVIATRNALQFITPLTLETLSKNPVYTDLFEKQSSAPVEHISITDWADMLIVAPASANIIGKFANGIADDVLSTVFLAFNKPVFLCPAMNTKMYQHFSVQRNIEFLKQNNIQIIEPVTGELACEWEGKGRMEEPENIVRFINDSLKKKSGFKGKKILITAGPTIEMIDPVRFISNLSSGLMGYAIAEEFASRGADVHLISGPTALTHEHSSIKKTNIVSADEMYDACMKLSTVADIIIMTAAVADFKPLSQENKKIKKENALHAIPLQKTKDILAELGKKKIKNQLLVGFALETDDEIKNAKQKLHTKNLDMIVINSLNDKGAGFKHNTNKITIIDKSGRTSVFGLKLKKQVAQDITDYIYEYQH